MPIIINSLILIAKALLTIPLLIAIMGGLVKETQKYRFGINLFTTGCIILMIWLWI